MDILNTLIANNKFTLNNINFVLKDIPNTDTETNKKIIMSEDGKISFTYTEAIQKESDTKKNNPAAFLHFCANCLDAIKDMCRDDKWYDNYYLIMVPNLVPKMLDLFFPFKMLIGARTEGTDLIDVTIFFGNKQILEEKFNMNELLNLINILKNYKTNPSLKLLVDTLCNLHMCDPIVNVYNIDRIYLTLNFSFGKLPNIVLSYHGIMTGITNYNNIIFTVYNNSDVQIVGSKLKKYLCSQNPDLAMYVETDDIINDSLIKTTDIPIKEKSGTKIKAPKKFGGIAVKETKNEEKEKKEVRRTRKITKIKETKIKAKLPYKKAFIKNQNKAAQMVPTVNKNRANTTVNIKIAYPANNTMSYKPDYNKKAEFSDSDYSDEDEDEDKDEDEDEDEGEEENVNYYDLPAADNFKLENEFFPTIKETPAKKKEPMYENVEPVLMPVIPIHTNTQKVDQIMNSLKPYNNMLKYMANSITSTEFITYKNNIENNHFKNNLTTEQINFIKSFPDDQEYFLYYLIGYDMLF